MDQSTSGGSSDTEANELTVTAARRPSVEAPADADAPGRLRGLRDARPIAGEGVAIVDRERSLVLLDAEVRLGRAHEVSRRRRE